MTPLVLWESNILDANRIVIPELDLEWRADRSHLALDRPFELNPEARPSLRQIERDVFEGRELMKARYYRDARGLFESALEAEKWNRDALVELAKLDLRQGLFASGIERINRARQLDAHDAEANFVAGSLYQATRRRLGRKGRVFLGRQIHGVQIRGIHPSRRISYESGSV